MKRTLAALVIPAALLLASCSDDGESTLEAATTSAVESTSESPTTTTPPAAADIYEVTPGGLTTAVNVPITKSDAEMAQGCIDAKPVLAMFGGDIEVTLAMMQATEADSTENFTVDSEGDPWGDATPSDQAAVIAALHAAADGDC